MTVDEFVSNQPQKKQILFNRLRKIILDASDQIEERIRYNIPFYDYKGMLCYLNPIGNGVDLGLCKGNLIIDSFNVLEVKNRKQIRTIYFEIEEDIELDMINEIMYQAIYIQETYYKKNGRNIASKK